MSHPNGYTKEMIRELLGTSCPQHVSESGCEERKRKGREIRAGIRPKTTYPSAYSYECKTCTIRRVVNNRKPRNRHIDWQYPDW